MISNIFRYIRTNKLGSVTVALSLTFMFLGLPAQIIKIWHTASVKDISLLTFSLLTIQSLFWVLYGLQKKDWFIIVPNFFGTIFAAMIVSEFFWFR